jgi:hypothetical protein
MAIICPPRHRLNLNDNIILFDPPNSVLIEVVLLSYLVAVRWANRLAIVHTSLTIGTAVFMIILWAISVGLFNRHDQMTTESDLWSWACHHTDQESPHVNWGQFCIEQVSPQTAKRF